MIQCNEMKNTGVLHVIYTLSQRMHDRVLAHTQAALCYARHVAATASAEATAVESPTIPEEAKATAERLTLQRSQINQTGWHGVHRHGERFRARFGSLNLGTFDTDTAEQALLREMQ